MADLIVAAILVLVVGFAVFRIRRAKKRGAHCIGCPSGCSCCAGKKKQEH